MCEKRLCVKSDKISHKLIPVLISVILAQVLLGIGSKPVFVVSPSTRLGVIGFIHDAQRKMGSVRAQ